MHVKMKSTRIGAAGHCRAGMVYSAEDGTAKADTLQGYVDDKVAEKLTDAQAKKALGAAAVTAAPGKGAADDKASKDGAGKE